MADAASAKDEGNAFFKAKDYQKAVEAYTRSLELSPSQHLCYSNRCAALLKMGEKDDEALADAHTCVELKPDWAKGYHRVCEALRQLKRSDEATAVLEKGLAEVTEPGKDRSGLEDLLKEVPKWQFCNLISGMWHGTVSDVLGGYEQEMEFVDAESVRVNVLGRAIVGKYSVDVSQEPHHLNIQVPVGDIPQGMPPPPPVPYIARRDEVGLHLCCPYLKMERPTEFTGPGYVLMKRGPLPTDDTSEVTNLSHKEKLQKCAQELLKVMPSSKLEDVSSGDSEDAAGEKLMSQVRFESSMYTIVRLYGEDTVKMVLAATRGTVPPELEGMQEITELTEKARLCGILDEDGAGAAAQASPPTAKLGNATTTGSTAAPESVADTAKPQAEDKQRQTKDAKETSGINCSTALGGVLFSAVALAAVAFMLSKKQRQ